MMTGWEVQEMEEMARNSQWEDLCKVRANDAEYTAAAKELGKAVDQIRSVIIDVEGAAAEVTGLPEYDRVVSLIDDLESVMASVEMMKEILG